MINKAIEKITKEMMENKNPVFQNIEEHLTKICINETVAKKILEDKKTLKGAYEFLEKEARKRSEGKGAVCISDAEAFEIIDKYFEIEKLENRHIDVMDLI